MDDPRINDSVQRPAPQGKATQASEAPGERGPFHHRERDFGVGYGNSSGYGTREHFLRTPAATLFRCS